MTQDLGESPIAKWGQSILQSSPEPEGSFYPSCQVDDELVRNTGIVLGFAYHAIDAKEELISFSGVPIQKTDLPGRLLKFVKVREAVAKQGQERLAKEEAEAEEARKKRREQRHQVSVSRDKKNQMLMKECFTFVDFQRFRAMTTRPEVSRNVETVLPGAVEDRATAMFAMELLQAPRRSLRSGTTPEKQANIAKRQAEVERKRMERAQKRKDMTN